MPGLPLLRRTRLSALVAFSRAPACSICSIRRLVLPERSFPGAARPASPLWLAVGASPQPLGRSSSCPDFWCMAFPRRTDDSLSSLFGPSHRGRRTEASPLLWPLLTSRSGAAPSPVQALGEISPGKTIGYPCTSAGFTRPDPWSQELRGCLPAHPDRPRLLSGFCPSPHRSRYPLLSATPSRLSPCGSLGSLRPTSQRTCTSKPIVMLGTQTKRGDQSDRPVRSSIENVTTRRPAR